MTEKRAWLYDVLFVCVLLIAGFLRLTGVEWGEGYHQHPDELFLVGVLDNLRAHTCADEITLVDLCKLEDQRWKLESELMAPSSGRFAPGGGIMPARIFRIIFSTTSGCCCAFIASQLASDRPPALPGRQHSSPTISVESVW